MPPPPQCYDLCLRTLVGDESQNSYVGIDMYLVYTTVVRVDK